MKQGAKYTITVFFFFITTFLFAQPILVSNTSSSGNVSSLTVSFTVSSNTNRILIVSVTSKDKNITSVKCGTTNLTQIALLNQNSMRSGLYYLIAPASGTANVVVAVASSSRVSAVVSEYRNVDQSAPFSNTASAKGKSDAPSLTMTSSTDELILASMSTIQENPSPGSGMTQISESSSGGSYNNFSRKAGASSVTLDYSFPSGNEDDWAIVAGSIKAATISLPVELNEFLAFKNNLNFNSLSWSTASEVNNNYFEIEKSFDGKSFATIAQIQGNGNSNHFNYYSFTDNEIVAQTCYYRLVQYDFDGTKSVYKTVVVEVDELRENMLINTAANSIKFQSLDENSSYKLLVYNSNGSKVLKANVNSFEAISLADLNAGIYVTSVIKNSQELILNQSIVVH
jgi:hypothetical protein